MIGVELPASGTATFHLTFSVLLPLSGKSFSELRGYPETWLALNPQFGA